jgi:hypothetical protein
MPLILSRLSSAKPKELFKYAIEWMVMKKIHPAFDSNSRVYDITFRKLDDEVKGLANSKFSSSAWTPDFTRALRARPDLMIMEISRGRKEVMDAHCEACNRRNHPASDELMFTGQPYNKETLEPLDNDTDSTTRPNSPPTRKSTSTAKSPPTTPKAHASRPKTKPSPSAQHAKPTHRSHIPCTTGATTSTRGSRTISRAKNISLLRNWFREMDGAIRRGRRRR